MIGHFFFAALASSIYFGYNYTPWNKNSEFTPQNRPWAPQKKEMHHLPTDLQKKTTQFLFQRSLLLPWKSKTKQRMVSRMIHIKDSLLHKWAKFGLWDSLGLVWVLAGTHDDYDEKLKISPGFRRHGLIAIASPCRRRPGQQLEPFYMARFALEVVQVSWDFYKVGPGVSPFFNPRVFLHPRRNPTKWWARPLMIVEHGFWTQHVMSHNPMIR